ncbi:hypothetical protein [Actinocrispum wychmicini]|uniref:hypothetical protein n=1 Tax=Actinocrispum wychmicini TaxID=1213861 RepID=UPI0010497BFB|nr:hypothetical protein [Actinocrispum wychmicini]
MTTAPGVQTAAQLLYVAIDLGQVPEYAYFQRQVDALGALQRYCVAIKPPEALLDTGGLEGRERWDYLLRPTLQERIAIVRTSMASPWETVLVQLAANSQPITVGLGALIGLHKLMRMVMEWQTFRQDLKERREGVRPIDGEDAARLLQAYSPAQRADTDLHREAQEALTEISPVVESDMIDPDDPRATGAT